jgi:hypothetical protein
MSGAIEAFCLAIAGSRLAAIFDAIRQMMIPPVPPRNPLGFAPQEDSA